MKFKYYDININEIIPQQHYLSKDKYNSVVDNLKDTDEYGDIYVIEYKGKVFSVDGHHRLFYLYKKGISNIRVVNEISDNDHKLYQILADEALDLGLKNIADLENRFIDNYDEYKKTWIDKCQRILKEQ